MLQCFYKTVDAKTCKCCSFDHYCCVLYSRQALASSPLDPKVYGAFSYVNMLSFKQIP